MYFSNCNLKALPDLTKFTSLKDIYFNNNYITQAVSEKFITKFFNITREPGGSLNILYQTNGTLILKVGSPFKDWTIY
jgi:hypothetical protein